MLRLLFLSDAIQAVDGVLAAKNLPDYDCFNIASADIYTTQQLAEVVLSVTGSNSPTNHTLVNKVHNKVLNIDRACRELGYAPGRIEDHIREQSQAWPH